MAVVTEEPFAIGVRYSVVGSGSSGARLALAFCCARRASFDIGLAVDAVFEDEAVLRDDTVDVALEALPCERETTDASLEGGCLGGLCG